MTISSDRIIEDSDHFAGVRKMVTRETDHIADVGKMIPPPGKIILLTLTKWSGNV